MKTIVILFYLLLLIVTFQEISSSTSKQKAGLDVLSSNSDCIVQGMVIKIEYKTSLTTGIPMTYTTVRITEAIKGTEHQTVIVRTPGGVINGKTGIFIDMPTFKPQEEVLLFLKRDKLDSKNYMVLGMSSGKYRIATDQVTFQKTAYNNEDNDLLAKLPRNKEITYSGVQEKGIPLSELLIKIKYLLLKSNGGK